MLCRFCFVAIIGCLTLMDGLAGAEDGAEQSVSEVAELRQKTPLETDIDRSLERYQVFWNGEKVALKVHPVLTWNNPVAGSLGKNRSVLFLKDGQAKAVCCIWSSGRNLYHEFGSLSRQGLRGEIEGRRSWEMKAGSQLFQSIPDSPPPANSRRLRMLQMKQLIKRFEAIELRNRQGEPDRIPLRLLTTPLYRYENDSSEILDGAVFGFVHTTDPEAMVVIEAVRPQAATRLDRPSELRWEYAFARRTTLPVEGQLDKQKVWDTSTVGFQAFNQLGYDRPPSKTIRPTD